MTPLHEAMQELRSATVARKVTVTRVTHRLLVHRHGPAPVGDLLQQLPKPSNGALYRIRIRLAAYRRRHWRLFPTLLPMAAAAAVLLVVVHQHDAGPSASATVIPPTTLDSTASWTETDAGAHVALSYRGRGAVHGERDDIHISWNTGVLDVDVDPQQGIQLEVATREASVRVVGTTFSVLRDTLGTHVTVRHGKVQVDCLGGTSQLLTAGQEQLCLPTSASGMLARSQTLYQQASHPESLTAAEAGIAMTTPDSAVFGELSVTRLNNLIALGRDEAAIREAERYLSSSNPTRGGEVQELLLNLALRQQDCQRALPLLRQLPSEALTATQRAWHQACQERLGGSGAP